MQTYQEELLEVWFQSIVARELSSQHHLTNILLNAEHVSPLLVDPPFARDDETNQFIITVAQLEQNRTQLLGGTPLFCFFLPSSD